MPSGCTEQLGKDVKDQSEPRIAAGVDQRLMKPNVGGNLGVEILGRFPFLNGFRQKLKPPRCDTLGSETSDVVLNVFANTLRHQPWRDPPRCGPTLNGCHSGAILCEDRSTPVYHDHRDSTASYLQERASTRCDPETGSPGSSQSARDPSPWTLQ